MSHFRLSQDLDESFSTLSRLGWVIFNSLKIWMRSDTPFWFSEFERIQETWGKHLTERGPGRLLAGNTPRLGAKRQIGSSGNLWECYEQVWNTINKRETQQLGLHPRMLCLCSPLWRSGGPVGSYIDKKVKSLKTWMSHFQVFKTWMRLFQVSRDLDASFSRSGIPIRETARQSEARRQPTRHSRCATSMLLCWQIRHLLSKEARDGHTCQGR